MVRESGGMEYAAEKMDSYILKAHQEIEDLPPSPQLTALKQLVDYSIRRKK
jgi:geranylgeranyl pyrophosphate synthase